MAEDSLPLFPYLNRLRRREPVFLMCPVCKQGFRRTKSRRSYCSRPCSEKRDAVDIAEKFWPFVEQTETCWYWHGVVGTRGYGVIQGQYQGQHRLFFVHRYSYMLHIGEIPETLTIDHLCRNKLCVNPLHLEAVTRWENVRRGDTVTGKNVRKTHCMHGHPFDETNTYYTFAGTRICKTCARRRDKERKERLRMLKG